MPHLYLVAAAGTAQRTLVASTLRSLEEKGYCLGGKQEGGDWVGLIAENRSGGFFDERKIVLVEEAEKLGPFPEKLLPLLEPQDAAVAIVLVYLADPAKTLGGALGKATVMRAPEAPRWPQQRQKWVLDRARELGISRVAPDAAALLVEWYDDLEELASELEKLAMAAEGGVIDADAVRALCLDDGSRDLLTLLDGLCEGRARDVATALLRMAERAELQPTVVALHNRFRLAWHAALFAAGEQAIQSALGARDYAWRLAKGAARLYGPEAIRAFVLGLVRIVVRERSGRGTGWPELELLVFALLSEKK